MRKLVWSMLFMFMFVGCGSVLPFVPKKPTAMINPATKQVKVVDYQATDGSTKGGVEARRNHQLEVEALEKQGFKVM